MTKRLLAALLATTLASPASAATLRDAIAGDMPQLMTLYRDLHANPELSMQEVRTPGKLAPEMRKLGFHVTEHVGKTVVVAQKDRPGFIANRIVAPVVVYNGLMVDRDGFTPADIDLSMMKNGQKMGPMELADFTGVDVTSFCQDYYHEHLSPEYEPSNAAKKLLAEHKLGKKTGQGYYTWPEKGRPVIDESLYTGKYNPDIPNFIQANEACKLLEEGVCSLEECDTAMELGYNMEGPIHYIQRFEPQQIADALNAVADHFGKEIFRPVATITTGAYKRG